MTEQELILQFKNASLSPEEFTHKCHLQIAFLYLQKYGLEKATTEMCKDLKNYVKQIGAEEKYNNDLTIKSVRLIDQYMKKSIHTNFQDFLLEFSQLKTNFKELIL